MKRRLIVLIICCGLFNKAFGQSASAAIDSLIKFRIITAKQRSAMEGELKYGDNYSYRVAVLGGLEEIMLRKTYHINPHRTGIFVSYGGGHLNKKTQDSINTSFRTLLQKINKAGLLTDRVYTYTLKDIDSGRYFDELQLIGSLTEMSSRLEWLAPDRLLPVAEQLHKSYVVSDSSFQRLHDDIKAGKIESASQLNDYCKLAGTFDLAKYPDDPNIWLERLHRDIASMLPGLNFTQFSYTATPDSASSIGRIPATKYRVSLFCNGHTYKHISVALNFGKTKEKIRFADMLAGGFYRIFNKVLADEQSPFRVHFIMFAPGKTDDHNFQRFSFIALRQSQTEVFGRHPCLSYLSVSMEDYDNRLTSARIDSTIAEWRKIGLFSHLSEDEIRAGIDDAEADNIFSMDNLLANFPRVTYRLNSEVIGPDYPYVNLLNHFSIITHGVFNPTKIKERKVKGGIKLQYYFNGRIHWYTFNTAMGWLDAKFPAFLKGLSQENNLPGNFYQLPDANAVIYLTKQQYSYILEHKLLDLETPKTGGRHL